MKLRIFWFLAYRHSFPIGQLITYITSDPFALGSVTVLMKEAARTSETSVDIQLRTRQYIPEDSELRTGTLVSQRLTVNVNCVNASLLLLFTGWYHTRRPIHCDHYYSIVLPHLSSNHSWSTH
jgi:hypothetical protein